MTLDEYISQRTLCPEAEEALSKIMADLILRGIENERRRKNGEPGEFEETHRSDVRRNEQAENQSEKVSFGGASAGGAA